ncbi:DedA family protein [Haloarchaeobius sp. HRN-SO-5]|uniref:DedA family protein n=1 Tax=Haloarchaeobius sp. HRN-SO-5 TaxID=3446118 RepID=UPI003EC0EB3D
MPDERADGGHERADGTATIHGRLRVFAEDYGLLVVAGTFFLAGVAGILLYVFGDTQLARELIDRYGLAALFCIFVLEGAMLLYFAPSELLVPFGIAALARTETGYDMVTVATILGIAVVGATIGQTLLFALAQRGGREWLLQKPWFRVDEGQLDRFDGWFHTWGRPAVPVSNALMFTRGMLTVPAGVAEMDVREFAALSAVGTLLFESWLAAAAILAIDLDLFGFL